MVRMITAAEVTAAVEAWVPRLACQLPADVCAALNCALQTEENPRGRAALETLRANACLAGTQGLPICQDTGTVRVTLEIGPDVAVSGDVFSGVDQAVATIYTNNGYRASVVTDALFNRANTKNNTPAFCAIEYCDEPGVARLHLMLKGGGSDNASRVIMLPPSAGRAGIVAEVVRCVREKAANACPPLVVGVGIGSTFDAVAGLSMKALRRAVGDPAATPEAAELEAELEAAIRELGIGAGAQGGAATAYCVHVETAPCHIAALPLAIDLGCSAMRRATVDLTVANAAAAAREACAQAADVLAATAAASAAAPADAATADGAAAVKALQLPLSVEALAGLKAGDLCTLSGTMYTLRDAGHARLMAEIEAAGMDVLPYDLDRATIFYAGPTPASPNAPERPFGAIGPTTASRMDAWAPRLHYLGIAATVGKGSRSADLIKACADTGSVYFSAIGGAAALLGNCVTEAVTVAYPELGTEALRKITVVDMPVTVTIDATGTVFVPTLEAGEA